MLEVRLLHLATKRLYDQLLTEQQLSDQLLLNVLPQSIAQRLKVRYQNTAHPFPEVIADSFPAVTVLFADIVDFTKYSEGVSAEALVNMLNDIFTRFDRIADQRGLEKIKTIGDAYMAAAGLPVPVADHAVRAADMAIDLIAAMDRYNAERACNLNIRIGISTGAAVAGVIGRHRFRYDLWGDVVNTASRMESHGVTGRIQIADSTRQALGDAFVLERRGPIEIKGKGAMSTWFLNGRTTPFAAGAGRQREESHPGRAAGCARRSAPREEGSFATAVA
jgi:class 3 adenylate cyclase